MQIKAKTAALSWLQAGGWKVSRRTFYTHLSRGFIRETADGFTDDDLLAYARAHLRQRPDGDATLPGLQERKAAAELARIEEQTAILRHKRERLAGRYIARADFDQEMAARAIVLQAGFLHFAKTSARDLIGMVEGDISREAEFVALIEEKFNEFLNQYAACREFQVIVFDGEEGQE